MKNLLEINHSKYPDLYYKAARQWSTTLFGALISVPGGVLLAVSEASPHSNDIKEVAMTFGTMCLVGVGVTGFGLGQLNETSHELSERVQATNEAPIV